MSLATRISGLTVVPVAVVGLTQFHYVISHISQIATGAAAITAGVAIWSGNAMIGKAKLRKEEKAAAKAEAVESASVDERIAALAEAMSQRPSLPRSTQVIDFTNASQSVAKRV
jgi:hypothetical protein